MPPPSNTTDGRDHGRAGTVLGQVAFRTGAQGALGVEHLVVHRANEDFHGWMKDHEIFDQVESAATGQVQIGNN
jgi:hypothetical protein